MHDEFWGVVTWGAVVRERWSFESGWSLGSVVTWGARSFGSAGHLRAGGHLGAMVIWGAWSFGAAGHSGAWSFGSGHLERLVSFGAGGHLGAGGLTRNFATFLARLIETRTIGTMSRQLRKARCCHDGSWPRTCPAPDLPRPAFEASPSSRRLHTPTAVFLRRASTPTRPRKRHVAPAGLGHRKPKHLQSQQS